MYIPLMSLSFEYMAFDLIIARIFQEILYIASKEVHPLFCNPVYTRWFTRKENQEVQQSFISLAKFNGMKDELRSSSGDVCHDKEAQK